MDKSQAQQQYSQQQTQPSQQQPQKLSDAQHRNQQTEKKTAQQIGAKVIQNAEEPISIKIFQQKLNEAIQLKNSGNSFFKQKNYVEAIKQYSKALKILDPTYFYGATEAECQKMAELSSNLLCNMGYCYFNSHDMQRADLFFSQAIIINPKYIKALHKRAMARFQLKKYQQSFEDIKLAFNLDKSNAEIHSAYSKILEKYNQQVKKGKEQMREMSSKIFNKESQKSNASQKQGGKDIKETGKSSESKYWSWGSKLTLAGAALLIGTGIYKALRH